MMEGPGATNTVQALVLVGGALYLLRLGLRWFVNQRGASAPGRQLRHVESCSLGPKQRLHLVELGGEQLLIGATEASLRLLRRRPSAAGRPGEPQPELRATPAPPAGSAAPEPVGAQAGKVSETLGAPKTSGGSEAPGALAWKRVRALLGGALAAAVLGWAPEVAAQGLGTQLPNLVGEATQPERISSTLELILILTLFSIAPSVLLMATCFTRVVIVLSLLRQALGVAQLPPNQVIIGLALAITVFAMAPVGAKIEREALNPYVENEIEAPVALERAAGTVRSFLLRHTRERDLALFVSLSESPPETRDDVALFTLLPSFMLSEIRTAFEIGFTIFLPFLIVDLVIASMLISMQMIVLPPIVISLPFKLMLFVLLDGWNLVAGSLLDGLR